MNKTVKLILWIVLIAVVLGGAAFAYKWLSDRYTPESSGLVGQQNDTPDPSTDGQTEPEENTPVPAPDFTVYDASGNAVKLSEHIGEMPIVLNFWASWCGPCKMEMPDFDEICAEYAGRVEFMMVNMTDGSQETLESAKKYIADSGYTFPVYFDQDMSAAAAYSVYSLPTTFVIDTDGNVYGYAKGVIPGDKLRDSLDSVLDEA